MVFLKRRQCMRPATQLSLERRCIVFLIVNARESQQGIFLTNCRNETIRKALVEVAPNSRKVKKRAKSSFKTKEKGRRAKYEGCQATSNADDKYGKIEVTESRWLSIEMIIFSH